MKLEVRYAHRVMRRATIACVFAASACFVTIDEGKIPRDRLGTGSSGAADAGDPSDAFAARDADAECARGACVAPCPSGMVGVPRSGGGSFCIDAREVTNADYKAFLGSQPSISAQVPICRSNESFVPEGGESNRIERVPVLGVDWCDALAYCTWAGKRLCGKVGGGASDAVTGYVDPSESEWFTACSRGGTRAYPYGATYASARCVGAGFDGDPAVTSRDYPQFAGTAINCEGGYDGIFDMSGNAAEWTDSCSRPCDGGSDPSCDLCRVRGGSFETVYSETARDTLACAGDRALPRNDKFADVGFRCCGG